MTAIGLSVVLASAVLLAAGRVKSRDQAVADADAPARAVLTAPVEDRVLRVTTVFRGQIVAEDQFDVHAAPLDGRDPVVSSPPFATGDFVPEGSSVVEVAGRPVLLLFGDIPAYRDLAVGDSGPDVTELEEALQRLGRAVGSTDGVFDDELAPAVAQTWRAAGYDPYRVDDAIGVRKAEILYVSALPAVVASVMAPDAQEVEGAVVRLAVGRLSASATVPPDLAVELAEGTAVQLHADDLAREWSGRIVAVGEPRTDAEIGTRLVAVSIAATARIPPNALGTPLRVTAETGRSRGRVLVVPVAAVFSSADGATQVVVRGSRGDEREVRVATGLSDGGYVEVRPVESRALEAGDEVVVGR